MQSFLEFTHCSLQTGHRLFKHFSTIKSRAMLFFTTSLIIKHIYFKQTYFVSFSCSSSACSRASSSLSAVMFLTKTRDTTRRTRKTLLKLKVCSSGFPWRPLLPGYSRGEQRSFTSFPAGLKIKYAPCLT